MKKLLKQLLAVTTAIMMAITLLPAMANAADAEAEPASPTTTIDYEKKGSITINKTTAIKDGKTTPLPGAEFTIYKIATLTADSTETSKLEKELSVTVNGKTYNTIGSLLNLDSATQKEVASKFADKVKTQTGIISDTIKNSIVGLSETEQTIKTIQRPTPIHQKKMRQVASQIIKSSCKITHKNRWTLPIFIQKFRMNI